MPVIKSKSYNVISTEPFDLPFPCQFELLCGNTLLAQYRISEQGIVDYSFNPNTSEKFLTPTNRPLVLNDIYFLLSSRVFPDKGPFTMMELERFELTEYNPYDIALKTHGILPIDKYWLRFEGEEYKYKQVLQDYHGYYERSYQKLLEQQKEFLEQQAAMAPPVEDVDQILKQHEVQFDELAKTAVGEPMSQDEFRKQVIGEEAEPEEAGKILSTDEIAALFGQVGLPETDEKPAAEASDEKMSDDAIAAMFANMGGASEPEPVPEPTDAPSEKMSDDAIAAMFAQMGGTSEPEPEPAPDPNAKMSDDAIAAMFAQMNAPAE